MLGSTATASLFLALLAATVTAEPISYVGTMTEESNRLLVDSSRKRVRASVSAPAPLGSFTHAFSALGDTEWTVTWQAPAGHAIQIASPAGAYELYMQFEFSSGITSWVGRFRDPVVPTVDIVHTTAPFPDFQVPMSLTGPGGDRASAVLEFDDMFVPGEVYQFTSFSVTTTVPASYNLDFDQPIEYFNMVGSAYFNAEDDVQASQWIGIVPITTACNAADIAEPIGTVDVLDLLDYLTLWFSVDLEADIDGDGVTDILDLLDFPVLFFEGC